MKTSSKILISILLAVTLWSGVGFDLGIKKTNFTLNIEKANAADFSFLHDSTFWRDFGMGFTDGERWWQAGRTAADLGAGVYTTPTTLLWVAILGPILAIMSGVLTVIAGILDGVIHLSISGFKGFIDTSDISSSWIIIRDVLNISFIFILLYIAITTIIGGVGVKTKVLIKDVIIGAILINFSLFFTRILIDGGNILATVLYNKLSTTSYGAGVWGLTGPIMNALNLQGLLSFNLFKATGQINAVFTLFFSIIIVAMAIWAFLYGAILFLLRNVMLLFLLAVSPIGFIGGTLPWFKEKASEWWSALLGQIMVAPFFLFMIYILIKMIDGMKAGWELLPGGVNSYFKGNSAINYVSFIQAFLVLGLLIIGIKMTKKMAGKMGDVAEKGVGLAITGAVSAVTLGAGALAARGASIAAKGATGQIGATGASRIANQAKTFAGLKLQRVGNVLSGKTFDDLAAKPNMLGRALTAGKKDFFSSVKEKTGVDIDAAFKNNKEVQKEYEKRHIEIANEIGGKAESDQLELLEKINKNIESQAETRAQTNHRDKREEAAKITDKDAREKEIARIDNLIKADTEKFKLEIAKEIGQNYSENKDKIKKLEVEIVSKQPAKNAYIAGIKNKKIADRLRSEKGVIKVTDETQEILKKLSKAMKENKIDLPGEKEAEAPKEEGKKA